METRKLEVLLKAAENGSLRKVAEELNYARTGLSYSIKSLEEEIGIQLIDRTTKGVSLTPEGKEIKPLIIRLMNDEAELKARAEKIRVEKDNTLRIGTYPIFANTWLPNAIFDYAKTDPKNGIDVTVSHTEEILNLLQNGKIDFAIGLSNILLFQEERWIPLRKIKMYAAIPKSFIENKKESITLEEATNYPLLFAPLDAISKQVEKKWGNKIQKKFKSYVNDGYMLLRLVKKQM